MKVLEVTITTSDGFRKVLPNPQSDDEVGRKLTEALAFELLRSSQVRSVKVERVTQYAGGSKGRYR